MREWLTSGGQDHVKNAGSALPRFKKKYWHLIGDVVKDLSIEFAAAGAFEMVKVLLVGV